MIDSEGMSSISRLTLDGDEFLYCENSKMGHKSRPNMTKGEGSHSNDSRINLISNHTHAILGFVIYL